jgi:hypothetical protein
MEPSLGTRLAIDSDNIRASLKVARTLADSSDFPETVSSLRLQEADLRGRIAFAHAQVRYQLDHRDYLVRDLERVCELIHNRSDSVEAGLVSPLSRNSRCPRSCCQQGQRLKRAIRVVGAPRTKRGLAPPPVVKFHPWLLIFHRMLSVSFFFLRGLALAVLSLLGSVSWNQLLCRSLTTVVTGSVWRQN